MGCTYIAVALMKEPARAKDLLAYSSLIVKASSDYDKEAWLGYDRLLRRQAAAEPAMFPCWGQINPSIWTQHFSLSFPVMIVGAKNTGGVPRRQHTRVGGVNADLAHTQRDLRPYARGGTGEVQVVMQTAELQTCLCELFRRSPG